MLPRLDDRIRRDQNYAVAVGCAQSLDLVRGEDYRGLQLQSARPTCFLDSMTGSDVTKTMLLRWAARSRWTSSGVKIIVASSCNLHDTLGLGTSALYQSLCASWEQLLARGTLGVFGNILVPRCLPSVHHCAMHAQCSVIGKENNLSVL